MATDNAVSALGRIIEFHRCVGVGLRESLGALAEGTGGAEGSARKHVARGRTLLGVYWQEWHRASQGVAQSKGGA